MKKLLIFIALLAFLLKPYLAEAKKRHQENTRENSSKTHPDCEGFYVGKKFKEEKDIGNGPVGRILSSGQYNTVEIKGIDKEANMLTIEITLWTGGKETHEGTCTQIKTALSDGMITTF